MLRCPDLSPETRRCLCHVGPKLTSQVGFMVQRFQRGKDAYGERMGLLLSCPSLVGPCSPDLRAQIADCRRILTDSPADLALARRLNAKVQARENSQASPTPVRRFGPGVQLDPCGVADLCSPCAYDRQMAVQDAWLLSFERARHRKYCLSPADGHWLIPPPPESAGPEGRAEAAARVILCWWDAIAYVFEHLHREGLIDGFQARLELAFGLGVGDTLTLCPHGHVTACGDRVDDPLLDEFIRELFHSFRDSGDGQPISAPLDLWSADFHDFYEFANHLSYVNKAFDPLKPYCRSQERARAAGRQGDRALVARRDVLVDDAMGAFCIARALNGGDLTVRRGRLHPASGDSLVMPKEERAANRQALRAKVAQANLEAEERRKKHGKRPYLNGRHEIFPVPADADREDHEEPLIRSSRAKVLPRERARLDLARVRAAREQQEEEALWREVDRDLVDLGRHAFPRFYEDGEPTGILIAELTSQLTAKEHRAEMRRIDREERGNPRRTDRPGKRPKRPAAAPDGPAAVVTLPDPAEPAAGLLDPVVQPVTNPVPSPRPRASTRRVRRRHPRGPSPRHPRTTRKPCQARGTSGWSPSPRHQENGCAVILEASGGVRPTFPGSTPRPRARGPPGTGPPKPARGSPRLSLDGATLDIHQITKNPPRTIRSR